MKGSNGKLLSIWLHFAVRTKLESLADRAVDGELDARCLVSLAPFLGSESLKRLMDEKGIGHMDPETIAQLAPFVDQQTLSKWIQILLVN